MTNGSSHVYFKAPLSAECCFTAEHHLNKTGSGSGDISALDDALCSIHNNIPSRKVFPNSFVF